MKIARINLIVQGMLLATLALLLVAMLFERGFMVWILYLYLLIGIVQYLTGWLLKGFFPADKGLKKYLIVASAMIALMVGTAWIPNDMTFALEIQRTMIFILPWAAAGYYWYLTFKGFTNRLLKKTFLF